MNRITPKIISYNNDTIIATGQKKYKDFFFKNQSISTNIIINGYAILQPGESLSISADDDYFTNLDIDINIVDTSDTTANCLVVSSEYIE
jgi:hypothetical protein